MYENTKIDIIVYVLVKKTYILPHQIRASMLYTDKYITLIFKIK